MTPADDARAAEERRDGETIAEEVRRSGIRFLPAEELATLRAYLATLPPVGVIREAYGHSDRAAEAVVDMVWEVLGREPSPREYGALAAMFTEAAETLRASAGKAPR